MSITDNLIKFLESCTDEILALSVVGGYMIGCFIGVDVPIEMPGGILAYYFIVKKPRSEK